MAPLTIGKVQIEEAALLLAPMEDITDRPFRMICKEQGADIVYTEFVNAEGLIRELEEPYRVDPSALAGELLGSCDRLERVTEEWRA